MATYKPLPVYRRTLTVESTEVPQFTTKPSVNLESELKKIEHLKKSVPAAYSAAVAEIKSHAGSEATAESLADLKELSEFIDFWSPLVSQAKDSQKELTMKFLLDGKELDDLKNALGNSTPWLTIESWAGKFTGIGKDRKFVEWLVPTSLGEKISKKVEENRANS